MTKTQIQAVVREVTALKDLAPTPAEQIGINCCVRAVALALYKTRKGFDRARFLKDCGVTP